MINDDDDELFYSHYWYYTLQLRATTTTTTTRTTTQILLLIKDSKILRIVKRSFVFFFVFEEVSFSLGTAVPLFDVDVPSALDEPFDDSY